MFALLKLAASHLNLNFRLIMFLLSFLFPMCHAFVFSFALVHTQTHAHISTHADRIWIDRFNRQFVERKRDRGKKWLWNWQNGEKNRFLKTERLCMSGRKRAETTKYQCKIKVRDSNESKTETKYIIQIQYSLSDYNRTVHYSHFFYEMYSRSDYFNFLF